ncbi:hypothetical protein MRX96_001612, partial [Rhipicephalus microplus]
RNTRTEGQPPQHGQQPGVVESPVQRLGGSGALLPRRQGSLLVEQGGAGVPLSAVRHTARSGCSGGSASPTARSSATREATRASRESSAGSAGEEGGGLVVDGLGDRGMERRGAGMGRCGPGSDRDVGRMEASLPLATLTRLAESGEREVA